MIYLDSAASYPILPEVQSTLMDAFESCYANSASSHLLGEAVSLKVNKVREKLANEIGAYPSEIIFTSGATESNNIAFKSILFSETVPKNKKHIITTQIEHKCIFAITEYLVSLGYEVTYIKPNSDGLITMQSIKEAIRPDTALVSVMHVNNELGTVNPIDEIGELCFENDIIFHSDAAQSFQKVDIDVDDLNVDIMSFSAHKIGGPKGIGAIYIRDLRHKELTPVIHGAGQEEGVRGGTVAAPLILGFGTAIEKFKSYYSDFSDNRIKNKLLAKLNSLEIEYVENGVNTIPHCISITFPTIDTETLVRDNENKLCLAQGSACSSKEIEPSHVLTSIGLSREMADKTFRISFSFNVTEQDLDFLCAELKRHNQYI